MNRIFQGSLDKSLPAVAVIMAGGSGTRFWPMSRESRPKQFLELTGTEESLIQATAKRLEPLVGSDGVLVVTAAHQAALVREQLPRAAILAEPVARNTAPCIGLAALCMLRTVGDSPMICLPADHMITAEEHLVKVLEQAVRVAAKESVLVTVGIVPTSPETGYGYIEHGEAASNGLLRVSRFVEKPNREKAEEYLRSGKYFWNSGMFVWRPSVILAAIRQHLPELAVALERIDQNWPGDSVRTFTEISKAYEDLKGISIDFGIMERADNVFVVSGNSFHWSDVGSWSAWADLEKPRIKEDGNFTRGDVVMVDSRDCFILSQNDGPSSKCIAGVGLKDLIIVQTDDAILVCNRHSTQDVKKVVDILKATGRKDLM